MICIPFNTLPLVTRLERLGWSVYGEEMYNRYTAVLRSIYCSPYEYDVLLEQLGLPLGAYTVEEVWWTLYWLARRPTDLPFLLNAYFSMVRVRDLCG